jgi:deoxyhypusine synthase
MTNRDFHDGRDDGLIPLESLSLADVKSFADLLRAMSRTAFGGRQLGEAFEILVELARRKDVTLVLTLSGAMTVAKQGRIICELIDRGLVQAVVATGALIAHGLTESIGLTHYRYDPTKSDRTLFDQGYNRIYDTLEMEGNLNDVERLVRDVINHVEPEGGMWSSARLCRALGQRLSEMNEGPGILRSAYERDVPVFIPAFTDSEIGLDVATWAIGRALRDRNEALDKLTPDEVFRELPPFNPFVDLLQYARLVGKASELGIFTIGGGVPRNWAQQVGPFYDITNHRVGTSLPGPRFKYGVRICPEPVHWGGLSGCTYSEGVSWGKFVAPVDGGRYAEVYADATVVWPLLMKAVFEELEK